MNPKNQLSTTAVYDIQLLFPVLFLVGIGIVMVYSASSAVALQKFGSDYLFLKKQAIFAVIGIVALVACRHFPYRWFRPLTYPLLAVALFLLLAIQLTEFGFAAGGSARWLRISNLTFQPSELARFAMVVFLAYSLEKKQENVKRFSIGFVPHIFAYGLFAVCIFQQPDFGAVVILGILTGLMMFVGGVRCTHLFLSAVALLPVAVYYLVKAEYRVRRLLSFLNPWEYPAAEGYQTVHSLMAFGSGGVWGTGIGKGVQKLFYLPEPHTDFIFAIIGEEFGLIGVLIIIGLYGLILVKGIQIARNAPDIFGSLMAFGLTSAMGLQVCINMGVALGLLPTKGLTLPFLSYGGTSLLLNMASVGILMNISAARKA